MVSVSVCLDLACFLSSALSVQSCLAWVSFLIIKCDDTSLRVLEYLEHMTKEHGVCDVTDVNTYMMVMLDKSWKNKEPSTHQFNVKNTFTLC